MARFRLLPIVIVCAIGVLGFKVDQLWRLWPSLTVNDALAKSPEDKASDPQSDAGKTAKGDKSMAMNDKNKPTAQAMAKDPGGPGMSKLVTGEITKGELEVLQSLAKRRELLERRSEELRLRENLMAATEKRVEEKISKLKSLEGQIKKLLQQHDKERESQLKSLVKVYENMKPKDAARIFEQLEMDILLQVTGRMREAKMAPVLAAMDPEKAKELTVELATRRKLPETGDSEG